MADTRHTDHDAKAKPRAAAADDQHRAADERREAAFKAEEKRRADEHKADSERLAAARKRVEARRKEDERRAALGPAERTAEDEKRAQMTPEERLKDDESKGLSPEQFDQINLLAGTPQYPIFTETAHAAEFILSEANGQRSRANAYLADPVTIKVGQPLKQTVAPTATTPGTFIPAAAGADCTAIALYGGTSTPTNGLRIAVLVRDAEVNGNLLSWGTITAPEQAIGLTTLAAAGIIARY
jgi:hypothetical protein